MDDAMASLAFQPGIIAHYLTSSVFPDTMRHQLTKLQASGVDLGSDMLFGLRLGFSGTPSDLLPEELKDIKFEPGSEAQFIRVLSSPEYVSAQVLGDWSPKGILTQIAASSSEAHGEPRGAAPSDAAAGSAAGDLSELPAEYAALIDTGALITGMGNEEVARFLLSAGLAHMEACVYIDGTGRKMVVDRSGAAAVPLDRAGVSKEHRFTFYDQYHTTGMDIKQALNAKAVVTLGKDMVWRDYTQGCYRMRGLGRGQTLHVLVVPEVHRLIAGVALAGAAVVGAAATKAVAATAVATGRLSSVEEALPYGEELLVAIVSWLIVNSMRSERLQHVALSQQKIHSIWRKRAFRQLLTSRAPERGESLLPSRFFSPTETVEEAKAIIAAHTVFTKADVARIEKVEEDDAAKKAFMLLLTRLQETGAQPMLIAQLRQVGDGLRAEAQSNSDAARAGMMPWKTALGVASNALKKMGFDVVALLAGTDVDPMTHIPAEIVANVATLKGKLAEVSMSKYSDITLAHALLQVDNSVASAVSFLLDHPPDPALEAQRVEKQVSLFS